MTKHFCALRCSLLTFSVLLLGLLRDGYDLIGQALTLFSSVCGVLHEDVCMCLRLLGRLSYILGENADVKQLLFISMFYLPLTRIQICFIETYKMIYLLL